MAKRDIQTVKAWVDQRDGAIYGKGVYGAGQAHEFSGNLPGKLPGTGTLPRLDQIAKELQQQGYKEIARNVGIGSALTVTFERVTPDNPWEAFDMARAPETAVQAPQTGDADQPEDSPEKKAQIKEAIRQDMTGKIRF